MNDFLNDRDFYELMQSYRHSDIADQKGTIEAFEAVKDYIRAALAQKEAEPVAICADDAGRVIWFVRPEARMPLYATPPAQPAPAVPDGWVMVPREATQDMCVAAVVLNNGNAVYKNVAAAALEIEEQIYAEVYEAMIAAAPGSAPAVPAVRTFSSDPECNYYATEGQVCTECGRIHRDSPVDIAPAAPAVREPLTDEQIWASWRIMSANANAGLLMPILIEVVRAVERAHGIGITGGGNG